MKRGLKKSLAVILAAMMLLSITQLLSFAWPVTPYTPYEKPVVEVRFTHTEGGDKNTNGKIDAGDYFYLTCKIKNINTLSTNQIYFLYDSKVVIPVRNTTSTTIAANWAQASDQKLTAKRFDLDNYPTGPDDGWSMDLDPGSEFPFLSNTCTYIKDPNETRDPNDPNKDLLSMGEGYNFIGGKDDPNGERIGHLDLTDDEKENGIQLYRVRFYALTNEDPRFVEYNCEGTAMWPIIYTDQVDPNTLASKYDAKNNKGCIEFDIEKILGAAEPTDPDPADVVELNKAIAAADALAPNKDNYTNWSAVETALATAKAIDQSTATADDQATIDAATNALNAAINALVLKPANYSAVDAAIAAIPANLSNYTDATVAAVNNAKNAVVRGYDITKQDQVDAMATAINNAVANLKLKDADYTAVDTAINATKAYDKNLYKNWSAVETAVNAVVRGYDITKQAQVNAMAAAINNAVAALVYKDADYSAVDTALATIPADMSIYTAQTVAAVNAAKDAVVRGYNITKQAEVNAMAAAITDAVSKLVLRPADYAVVDTAIANVPKDLTVYTDATVAAVNKAVSDVVRGLDITKQAQVNAMAEAINAAVAALELKPVANKYTLTVVANNGTVTANGTPITSKEFEEGTTVNLVATANEGYTFAYWTDAYGRIISADPTYTTTVAYSNTINAVFTQNETNVYTVTFIGLNGKVVKVELVEEGQNATAPEAPFYAGFTFAGWNGDYTAVTANTTIHANYTVNVPSYTVTPGAGVLVNGSASAISVDYNTRIDATVSNTANFKGWSIDGGNTIVSYAKSYTFYAGTNVTVTAVYGAAEEAKPISAITSVQTGTNQATGKGYVVILTERTAPEGYSLVSSGVIYSATNKDLTIENANAYADVYMNTTTSQTANGQYRLTINVTKGRVLNFRSFAVYKNANGEIVTVYSDAQSAKAE